MENRAPDFLKPLEALRCHAYNTGRIVIFWFLHLKKSDFIGNPYPKQDL
jgi:hypothetical protein